MNTGRPHRKDGLETPVGVVASRIHYPAGFSQYETGVDWSQCHADHVAYLFAEAAFPPVRGARKPSADQSQGEWED